MVFSSMHIRMEMYDDKGINTNKELLKYDLVVTTTGNVNVLDRYMLNELKSGCVVCNIGHFDNEIDIKYLKTFEWYEVKPGVHKVLKAKMIIYYYWVKDVL